MNGSTDQLPQGFEKPFQNVILFVKEFAWALVVIYAVFLTAPSPVLFPRTLMGWGMDFGAYLIFAAYISVGYWFEQFIQDQVRWYWPWRICGSFVYFAAGMSLIWALAVTADTWLPHFR